MRKNSLLLFLLSICCLIIFSACQAKTAQEDPNAVKLVDANAEIQSLYSNRCLNCHAIDLSGKMGEQTNLQKTYERLTYEEIVDVISHGREIMPAFSNKLTEQEISDLASWLSKQ